MNLLITKSAKRVEAYTRSFGSYVLCYICNPIILIIFMINYWNVTVKLALRKVIIYLLFLTEYHVFKSTWIFYKLKTMWKTWLIVTDNNEHIACYSLFSLITANYLKIVITVQFVCKFALYWNYTLKYKNIHNCLFFFLL